MTPRSLIYAALWGVVVLTPLADAGTPGRPEWAGFNKQQKDRAENVVEKRMATRVLVETFEGKANTALLACDSELAKVAEINKAEETSVLEDILRKKESVDKRCNRGHKHCARFQQELIVYSDELLISKATEFKERENEAMDLCVESLLDVQIEGVKNQEAAKKNLKYVTDVGNDALFKDLGAVFSEDKKDIEYQLELLVALCDDVSGRINTYKKVMYGQVCFELSGAEDFIDGGNEQKFTKATSAALEMAFVDEDLDFSVVRVAILSQYFVDVEPLVFDKSEEEEKMNWPPNKNKAPSIGADALPSESIFQPPGLKKKKKKKKKEKKEKNKTRLLRSRELALRRLRIGAVIGFQCSCKDDKLLSDVSGRRQLGERLMGHFLSEEKPRRQLWSETISEAFADLLMDELNGIGKIDSVVSIPCAEMDSEAPTV